MSKNKLKELQTKNEIDCMYLEPEDFKKISRVMKYMGPARICSLERELMRRDLIGIAQEARLRNETLEEALGAEKEFCDSVVTDSLHANKKEYGLLLFKKICEMLALIAVPIGITCFFVPWAPNYIETWAFFPPIMLVLMILIPVLELHLHPEAALMRFPKKLAIYSSSFLLRFCYFMLTINSNLLAQRWNTESLIRIDFRPLGILALIIWPLSSFIYNQYLKTLAGHLDI